MAQRTLRQCREALKCSQPALAADALERELKLVGDVQVAQSDTTVAPRVRRHSKVAPASPVKLHEGVSELSGVAGDEVMLGAAGAVVSSR